MHCRMILDIFNPRAEISCELNLRSVEALYIPFYTVHENHMRICHMSRNFVCTFSGFN